MPNIPLHLANYNLLNNLNMLPQYVPLTTPLRKAEIHAQMQKSSFVQTPQFGQRARFESHAWQHQFERMFGNLIDTLGY